jgi:hypothetical protein
MSIQTRIEALERAFPPDDGRCQCNPRRVAVKDESLGALPQAAFSPVCPKCGGLADVMVLKDGSLDAKPKG